MVTKLYYFYKQIHTRYLIYSVLSQIVKSHKSGDILITKLYYFFVEGFHVLRRQHSSQWYHKNFQGDIG